MYQDTTSWNSLSTLFAGLLIFGIIALFASFVTYILTSIGYQQIFKKFHHPRPWAAWIPYYRTWSFYTVGGQPGWLCLIPLVPGVLMSLGIIELVTTSLLLITVIFNIVVFALASAQINRGLHKQPTVLWVFFSLLFTPIWALIAGFSNDALSKPVSLGKQNETTQRSTKNTIKMPTFNSAPVTQPTPKRTPQPPLPTPDLPSEPPYKKPIPKRFHRSTEKTSQPDSDTDRTVASAEIKKDSLPSRPVHAGIDEEKDVFDSPTEFRF